MVRKKYVRKETVPTTAYTFPNSLIINSPFLPQPEMLCDEIITIKKFFTPKYCHELISSFGILTLETTPLVKSKDYAPRFNGRFSVYDPVQASNLWCYLQKILINEFNDPDIITEFSSAIGLNPNLRLYRYEKGHFFGKHYDESVKTEEPNGFTKFTLLIYLTGDEEFEGGDTVFYPVNTQQKSLGVHPSSGMALLHKHGDDCLLHEAELVSKGTKWVLRSDVVFPH